MSGEQIDAAQSATQASHREPSPADAGELARRAEALTGRGIDDVASSLGFQVAGEAARTKGKVGELVERALGASGGSSAVHDFPHLGIELKTIPMSAGTPRESTYVCTVVLADAERAEWATSWARAKLSRVLWVPVDVPSRRFGVPLFWSPTADQEDVLRGDFEDAMGTIAIGGVEGLRAGSGRWLQVRPKARDGSVRVVTRGRDNEIIETIPRGFYLRTLFTGAILRDGSAMP